MATPIVRAESLNVLCPIYFDCTAPSAPSFVAPGVGEYRPSIDFSFEWTTVEDESQPVSYAFCVAPTTGIAAHEAANRSCNTTEAGVTTVPAGDVISGDGAWDWSVAAKDAAGNQSDWTNGSSVVIDTIDPVVTGELGVSSTDLGGSSSTTHIYASVSDDNLQACSITINGPAGVVAGTPGCVVDGATGVVDGDWSVAGLESGEYSVNFVASDRSGRAVGRTVAPVRVDNSGPAVTITGGNRLISAGSVSPTVVVADAHGEGITYQWEAGSGNTSVLAYEQQAAEPIFTPKVDGTYNYFLTVRDVFGNTSGPFRFTFDYWQVLEPIAPVSPDGGGLATIVTDPASITSTVAAAIKQQNAMISRPADTEVGMNGDATAAIAPAVLGVLSGNAPADAAPIAATGQGWRILGILWYWWIVLGVVIIILIALIRRRYSSQIIKSI